VTRSVTAVALLVALAAPAAHAARKPLPAYVTRTEAQIGSYRAILTSLDRVLRERPVTNVDPTVEKLNAIAGRFDRLDARWVAARAPKGLLLRHRGMGRAFRLQAQAWRLYAAALFTRHQDEIDAASVRLDALLRSAAYLQKRWAAALQGALIRAELRVSKWLHGMAKTGP
jgi:hypothetical protein